MNFLNLFRRKASRITIDSDSKYDQAMKLSEDVIDKMRERAASPDPFRALMADMFLQNHDIDVALVADAFEASQEARIFKGESE